MSHICPNPTNPPTPCLDHHHVIPLPTTLDEWRQRHESAGEEWTPEVERRVRRFLNGDPCERVKATEGRARRLLNGGGRA